MYELRIRRCTEKALDKLRGRDYERVVKAVQRLKENPRPTGCEKLADDIYRIRVGAYRIIYLIDDREQVVDIGKVDRR